MLHLNEIYELCKRFHFTDYELEELQLTYLLSNKTLTKAAIKGLYKRLREKTWSKTKEADFKVFGNWVSNGEFCSFFYYMEDWIEGSKYPLNFELSIYLGVIMRAHGVSKLNAKRWISNKFSSLIQYALKDYISFEHVAEYGLQVIETTFNIQIPDTPVNYPASYWNMVDEDEFLHARRYTHLSQIQYELECAAISELHIALNNI